MKLGINTVDEFSGDHSILNVRSNMTDMSLVEHVRQLAETLAVDTVELPANLMVMCPHLFTDKTIRALAELQQNLGISYTVHLPFRGLDLSSLCRPIGEVSVKCYREIMAKLESSLLVDHYVLHLTETMLKQVAAKPHWSKEDKQRVIAFMYNEAERRVEQLLAPDLGHKVLLENIKSGYTEPFALARRLGLDLCCDIGHLLLEHAPVLDVLDEYGSFIREIHLHDAVLWTQSGGQQHLVDHMALGSGALDVDAVLAKIRDTGFSGTLLVEVGRFAAAQSSIALMRNLLEQNS